MYVHWSIQTLCCAAAKLNETSNKSPGDPVKDRDKTVF